MNRNGLWVVIPVKDFVNAKQRLSGVLSPSERRALSQAMVEDMLECLRQVGAIDGVLLVSDDPGAELLAYRYGARVIKEKGHSRGLNAAVEQAARYLPSLGASHMLVLHGDLPGITSRDVNTLIAELCPPGEPMLRLAPDARRQGSNGLLCSLPAPIGFRYGNDSFTQHRAACEDNGTGFDVMDLPSLQLDIDTPRDLQQLLQRCRCADAVNTKTCGVLAEYGVANRLRQMRLGDDPPTFDDHSLDNHALDK